MSGWDGWPFSGYGYEGGILPSLARFAFVFVLIAVLALILRLLYGPKGPLRGKGWETIKEAREREEREREGGADSVKFEQPADKDRDASC